MLVDGYNADDAELARSYGFKKVLSLKELLSLDWTLSMWIGCDFYESKLDILRTRRRVLKRFGMSLEELTS